MKRAGLHKRDWVRRASALRLTTARRRATAARRAQLDAHRLTTASVTSLARRLPLLYCVVIFNVGVLAASFRNLAPPLLTVAIPLFLVTALAGRAIHWLPELVARRRRSEQRRDLNRLRGMGGLAAFACTLWALALYSYGDVARQSLVHYLTAVTCFTGILGLGQSPKTALRMAVVTMVPSTVWFATHGHPNAFAICGVQLMVSALLLLLTKGHYDDFVALELSRQELAARERESTDLAASAQLEASRDTLTGAASRGSILATLEAMLADNGRPPPWLALVDLDGFKHVNDTFGHPAGDHVLRTVCERIRTFDKVLACGRLGGDEFALLIAGSRSGADVHAILAEIVQHISRPIAYESFELTVSASIGFRQTGGDALTGCLERADEALYRAKRLIGSRVVEFGADDERAMRTRTEITKVFCSADLASRIGVAYQPIVDLDRATIFSFEALARWNTGDGDALSPDTFIPLAESTGRISELTQLVLERALRECRAWESDKFLSVNLSARDILRDDAASWLGGIVANSDAPPAGIIFEITESALIADLRRAAAALEALRQRGFQIALDDFGTGQSSLSHVHRLPLDHIKLDRSFARDLESSRSGRAVAATVLALARQLDLSCSIEGIESAAQAAAARSLGFRLMQGYHLGRPTSAEALSQAGVRAA